MPGGTTAPEDNASLPTLSNAKEHDLHSEAGHLDHSEDDGDDSDMASDTTGTTNSSDEFNWDEEDEAVEEQTRRATKAKRGRALYVAFMKLARPFRVILIGVIGASILITPLLVVELKFKSSPARLQVHVWSLWLTIIWAAIGVTYLVVDSIPRLVVALTVLFGGQVERLKTEVEVWIASFVQRDRRSSDPFSVDPCSLGLVETIRGRDMRMDRPRPFGQYISTRR